MTQPDKELLAELLLRWEELKEKGQDTPATELAKDHPHLIHELSRRIKALKTISWLDKPLGDDPPPSEPSSVPHPPSRTLANRYHLDELIAEGGFAQVFRGYDTELQRTVAIKVPKPSRLESTESFQAEARRAARLKHDNIVPVYDVGTEGTTCFIVTEYVEGGSLADRLVKGKPTPQQTIRWISDIADALEHAHLNGVIHRDIKPANILIDQHGRAKLTDFGIAQSVTKSGTFTPSLGTLSYMSPEILEGKSADHRSDLYSLAVVLYEALTGRIPYTSSEPNVLRKEIALGQLAAWPIDVPSALTRICQKSLSRSPYERHASAAQFAAEIQQAEASTTGTTLWPWLALLASLSALAGLAYLYSRQNAHPTQVAPASQNTFKYDIEANGVVITGYTGRKKVVTVPEMIDGRPVVAIGNDAFNGQYELTAITIPPTVTVIGNAAFAGCSQLATVTLPAKVTDIGFNAFQYCTALSWLAIPASVRQIGAVCFFGSSGLTAIDVAKDNEKFSSVDGVLYDKALTTLITCPPGKSGVVTIPPTVKRITGLSFAGCQSLSRVIIPPSVTEVDPRAFEDCDAIQEMIEPAALRPSDSVPGR